MSSPRRFTSDFACSRRLSLGLRLSLVATLLGGSAVGAAPPAFAGDPSSSHASEAKTPALPPLPPEYVSEDDGWLRLGYHPSVRERLRVVMPRIAEMRDQLRTALGTNVLDEVEIRIAALDVEMVRLTPGELVPPASGAMFTDRHLLVLTAGPKSGGDAQDLEVGIRYQLARLALAEAVSPTAPEPNLVAGSEGSSSASTASASASSTSERVPAWFEEGFAVTFAHEREASRSEALLLATMRGALPHAKDLQGLPRDSAFAADFVRFLSETNDASALPAVVEKLRNGSDLEAAISSALGEGESGVDRAWRKDMSRRYGLLPVLALSVVLWVALWGVGLWRKRRASLATEATRARNRTLRRARAMDADSISVAIRSKRESNTARRSSDAPRKHDDLSRGAREHASETHAAYAAQPSARVASTARAAAKETVVEVPRVEHDGDWHTLH